MLAQVGAPAAAMRAHEEMFAYWASRRESGRLPGRAHIHPAHIKRHLPTVSLIDVIRGDDGARSYRLRLAGTGLYGVYGGEITGKRLHDVYAPDAADYWRAELDKVVRGSTPRGGRALARPGAAPRTCRSCGCACRWPPTGGRWT